MQTIPPLTRRAFGIGIGISAAALLAAGCASKPDVRSDLEPGNDLSAYRSFAFYDPYPSGYATLLEGHLRRALREQLERRQLRHDEREPDLLVNYALQVVDKQELQASRHAGPRYRTGLAESIETVDVRQGTLLIDLVDARRQALVWRAVAEGRIDSAAMKQPAATIDAVVGDLFARFPGGVKP